MKSSHDYKSKITREGYLQAFALFTMAHNHYVESTRFAEALNKIIMTEPTRFPGGHVDDLIYSDELATAVAFDEALRKEGIEVENESAP